MTIAQMCNGWAKTVADGGSDKSRSRSGCRVYWSGQTIYSYGDHFPMGYILAPNLVWLNGDRFSVSTTNHQGHLRSALRLYAPDATVVIVPRTALQAAAVDYRSIQPVHIKTESWEYELLTAPAPPLGMRPVEDLGYRCAYFGDNRVSNESIAGFVVRDGSHQAVRRDSVGMYSWHTARHWLGDAVFTAIRDRTFNGTVGERVHFISSFDRQERTPLYFLSQLPAPVDTVEDAIESLAPESVKTARDIGRAVVRQGDMFAVGMNATTRNLRKMGATFTKRRVTVTLNGRAAESVAQRDALQAVVDDMPPMPERWVGDHWRERLEEWQNKAAALYTERFPDLPTVTRHSVESTLKYQPRKRWDYVRTVEGSALYGTAHTASDVATLPDGRQFARGTMYHEPSLIGERWRDADHARRPLGTQWHLVARNTVPVSGTGRGRRLAG